MVAIKDSLIERLTALVVEAHETEDLYTQTQKVAEAYQLLVESGCVWAFYPKSHRHQANP